MSNVNNFYRQQFRKVSQQSSVLVFPLLGELRRRAHPNSYPAILKGLQIGAPKHSSIALQRPKHFQDLLYTHHLHPATLEGEIRWASLWITPYFKQINDLNHTRDILQSLLAEGNLSEMNSTLEEFIKRQGWSMWAAELKFALTQQIGGNEATRTLSANLQGISKNRAGGLFAQIFSERNEEGFSFDSFQTKCENSLSRFKDGWLSSYLPYRATSFIVDPERDFPLILSCEITSSLFDYYEAVMNRPGFRGGCLV